MSKKTEVNWSGFLSGESELKCESIEDVGTLIKVCAKNNIYGLDSLRAPYVLEYGLKNPYWYIKNDTLNMTKYTLENDDICDCWTVSDYIENHTHYIEETEMKENNKHGLDCSMIRHVRVPHEQFVAIQNKAEYLIVEDRDNGGCVYFNRAKEVGAEESQKILDETLEKLKTTREQIEETNRIIESLNVKITNGNW